MEIAPPHFHPTLDASSKEYRYQICMGTVQEPIHRAYSWHVPHCLDQAAMQKAAQLLVGTHNFSSFTTLPIEEGRRTLFEISLVPLPENRLEIRLIGERFLYKMARRIAGTLVDVGKERLTLENISKLLTTPDRAAAGITAPAHGLHLHQVFYPQSKELS